MTLSGWIIYNGMLPGDKFIDFAQMFHEAAKKENIKTTIYKNNELLAYLTHDHLSILQNENVTLPDFVISTDKDIYLAKLLELLGVRVFNRADIIHTSDDKILTHQMLAKENIRTPATIVSPKTYLEDVVIDHDLIDQVIEQLSLPLVIKEAFGSFGEQVYLVETKEQLIKQVKVIGNKPFIFQQFIASSYGKDLRLQVVGDEVVASMMRSSKNDFRANITSGGSMEPYEATEEEKQLAIKATKAICADFAGVDLLFGEDGKPIVCEVNSNAHIRNMYTCTGINAAEYIIRYIKKQLTNKGDLS
ncbi:MAG TPA: RimK family alpha-L-glutamate ligase [Bacillota bacterium]|nr:RimK family alpha-L-glutamate ligase [Bacillota bacterium]